MPVISVEHLPKTYRLGLIDTGMFRHGFASQHNAFADDLKFWWAKMRVEQTFMDTI